MSRGGYHEWFFSSDSVYEVHQVSIGDRLYEIRKILKFPWNSNLIVVPPGMIPFLEMRSIEC